jgi:MFS family permease
VNGKDTTIILVISRIFIGIGGGITIISTQVASQGSVPHSDLAISIAILSLLSSVGGAVGSAIAASIWNKRVPRELEARLGGMYDTTELADIFGSIVVARLTEPRDIVKEGE